MLTPPPESRSSLACARCGRLATLKIDRRQEFAQDFADVQDFCADCAREITAMSDLLPLMLHRRVKVTTCPFCGTTAAEVKSTGLVGCPLCYEALPEHLWGPFGLK